jgi:hypothetical protein
MVASAAFLEDRAAADEPLPTKKCAGRAFRTPASGELRD